MAFGVLSLAREILNPVQTFHVKKSETQGAQRVVPRFKLVGDGVRTKVATPPAKVPPVPPFTAAAVQRLRAMQQTCLDLELENTLHFVGVRVDDASLFCDLRSFTAAEWPGGADFKATPQEDWARRLKSQYIPRAVEGTEFYDVPNRTWAMRGRHWIDGQLWLTGYTDMSRRADRKEVRTLEKLGESFEKLAGQLGATVLQGTPAESQVAADHWLGMLLEMPTTVRTAGTLHVNGVAVQLDIFGTSNLYRTSTDLVERLVADPATADGLITLDQAAFLLGLKPHTLQTMAAKDPYPTREGPNVWKYSVMRPWIIRNWPKRVKLIPEIYAEAKQRFAECPTWNS